MALHMQSRPVGLFRHGFQLLRREARVGLDKGRFQLQDRFFGCTSGLFDALEDIKGTLSKEHTRAQNLAFGNSLILGVEPGPP